MPLPIFVMAVIIRVYYQTRMSVRMCVSQSKLLASLLTRSLPLPLLHSSLRSGSTSTPSGPGSLTVWTWLPSASSPSTPSSTPGFSSSSPPVCCTFFGPRPARPPWQSLEVRCLKRLWPNRTLQPTWSCLSRRWRTRSLSALPKHYDHLKYLMMWHLYLLHWRVRCSYTTYVLF